VDADLPGVATTVLSDRVEPLAAVDCTETNHAALPIGGQAPVSGDLRIVLLTI
jgi:hypothetical protein